MSQKTRCSWVNLDNPVYVRYHDEEWGKPVFDDKILFEFLILEGAQAGLSWETVLNKRAGYREVFCDFDVGKCSQLSDAKLQDILHDTRIIRNRLKVYSVRNNARVFLDIQKEFGSFSAYLWSFTSSEQIKNTPKTHADIPVKTQLSDTLSKDLKKRTMTFVGSTIIYAYLQAVGIIDDHTKDCFCKK